MNVYICVQSSTLMLARLPGATENFILASKIDTMVDRWATKNSLTPPHIFKLSWHHCQKIDFMTAFVASFSPKACVSCGFNACYYS